MTLYLMNSPILVHKSPAISAISFIIDKETARKIVKEASQSGINIESAIGHELTAKAFSKILGIPVECNRKMVSFEPGDFALVFKLAKRLPEGAVIENEEQLEEIGYVLQFLVILEMRHPSHPVDYVR